MLSTVIAYLSNTIVVGTICLVVGVVFSQKIKDWITGVPSEFRAAMNSVEAKARADIATATSTVLQKLPVLAPVTAAVTAAPAPAAPAPVAPAAPAAPAAEAPKAPLPPT